MLPTRNLQMFLFFFPNHTSHTSFSTFVHYQGQSLHFPHPKYLFLLLFIIKVEHEWRHFNLNLSNVKILVTPFSIFFGLFYAQFDEIPASMLILYNYLRSSIAKNLQMFFWKVRCHTQFSVCLCSCPIKNFWPSWIWLVFKYFLKGVFISWH